MSDEIKCPFCKLPFTSQHAFDIHRRKKHPNPPGKFYVGGITFAEPGPHGTVRKGAKMHFGELNRGKMK
jgi:hypothetical protein